MSDKRVQALNNLTTERNLLARDLKLAKARAEKLENAVREIGNMASQQQINRVQIIDIISAALESNN